MTRPGAAGASVAVWQLPSTEPVLKQQMECSLSLPPVPRVVTRPDVPAIPSPESPRTPQCHKCLLRQVWPRPRRPVSLCPVDPAPELGQSQPITGGQFPPILTLAPEILLLCPFRQTKLWTILWTIFPERSSTACDLMAGVLCKHKKLRI